jgi:hypothetical protein
VLKPEAPESLAQGWFTEWIKSNIELAKRNEKVTPNWKKEI